MVYCDLIAYNRYDEQYERDLKTAGGGDYLILKKKEKRPNFEDKNVLNVEKKKKKAQDIDENILERLQSRSKFH